MSEKTTAFIEAMKKQTIGVEVEMNNITRQEAAKPLPPSSVQADANTQREETDMKPGVPGTAKAESGSFKRMSASAVPTTKNARW